MVGGCGVYGRGGRGGKWGCFCDIAGGEPSGGEDGGMRYSGGEPGGGEDGGWMVGTVAVEQVENCLDC